jgi:hypothetical protein
MKQIIISLLVGGSLAACSGPSASQSGTITIPRKLEINPSGLGIAVASSGNQSASLQGKVGASSVIEKKTLLQIDSDRSQSQLHFLADKVDAAGNVTQVSLPANVKQILPLSNKYSAVEFDFEGGLDESIVIMNLQNGNMWTVTGFQMGDMQVVYDNLTEKNMLYILTGGDGLFSGVQYQTGQIIRINLDDIENDQFVVENITAQGDKTINTNEDVDFTRNFYGDASQAFGSNSDTILGPMLKPFPRLPFYYSPNGWGVAPLKPQAGNVPNIAYIQKGLGVYNCNQGNDVFSVPDGISLGMIQTIHGHLYQVRVANSSNVNSHREEILAFVQPTPNANCLDFSALATRSVEISVNEVNGFRVGHYPTNNNDLIAVNTPYSLTDTNRYLPAPNGFLHTYDVGDGSIHMEWVDLDLSEVPTIGEVAALHQAGQVESAKGGLVSIDGNAIYYVVGNVIKRQLLQSGSTPTIFHTANEPIRQMAIISGMMMYRAGQLTYWALENQPPVVFTTDRIEDIILF